MVDAGRCPSFKGDPVALGYFRIEEYSFIQRVLSTHFGEKGRLILANCGPMENKIPRANDILEQ